MIETAFLTDSGKIWFVNFPSPSPFPSPTSAVVQLIQGIYEHDPEMARKIVRNRIYSTAKATEMCLGMVKVAAKRLTAGISEEKVKEAMQEFAPENRIDLSQTPTPLTRALPFENEETPLPPSPSPSESSNHAWMRFAQSLLDRHSSDSYDLPVAALLLSEGGELLSWAVNTAGRNRTLHAEVNLLQSYFRRSGKPLPHGSQIITTLKPCKMCAGMIWSFAESVESLRVIYGKMDEGTKARETVLDVRTFERKRASKNSAQLKCEISLLLG